MTQTSASHGLSLDATALLNFGSPRVDPLPEAESGLTVVRYGGWSLLDLYDQHSDLSHIQDWYDTYPWATEKLPSGLYALRLPVPNSNLLAFPEQRKLLLPGEEPSHVVLAATALLAMHCVGLPYPLRNGIARCAQQTIRGHRVGLGWFDGRLVVVGSPVGYRRTDSIWLVSARKLD